MKATELMIGDWVYLEDMGICAPVMTLKEGYEYKSRPIPLTPEILEKNGFKFDGSGQRSMMFISTPHFDNGIRYNIYVGLKNKTIEVFAAHPVEKSPNWRKSNKVYLEVCGCFVHELQHALRLCGIEKDIIV